MKLPLFLDNRKLHRTIIFYVLKIFVKKDILYFTIDKLKIN